jgi:hypothetical protein
MSSPGTPGSGPARGVPWWRHWRGKLRTWRHETGAPPMVGLTRPGRVIHTIREAGRR